MKKNILSLMALFTMMTVSAENSLQVVPFAATVNADTYAYIEMNNENPVAKLSFDLYLPEGFRVYTNKSGNLVSSSLALDNSDGRVSYYDEDEEDDVSAFSAASGYNFIVDESGKEFFRYGGAGQFPVAGTSGKVFKIRIKVDASVEPGIYPIYMKNVTFLDTESQGPHNMEFASYIVVGNPLNANLSLTGEIPSFVNAALASETGIECINLSDVTASHGTFTYVDGRDVVAPATEVKADVAYKRAAGSNTYASLKLPFPANVNCYKFDGVDAEYAHFSSASSVAADESVIVSGAIDVTASNVALGAAQVGKADPGQFYLKNDEFHSVNVTAVVPAFRGIWNGASSSNLRLAIDGVLTGISAAQLDTQSNTYDLQGRQATNAKNGVFVVNGKKQFVK